MMSSVEDGCSTGVAADAPRVGAELRAARERLGLDLTAVAAALRIRLPFLQALEDGRTGDLPGNAYAVGFLRTYGAALGLDADEIAQRFRDETASLNVKTRLAFPVPVPERGVPAGAVVLLGVVLAVGAYAGWYRLSGDGVLPAEVVPAVPERLVPLAQQAIAPFARPGPRAAPVDAPALVQPAGEVAEVVPEPPGPPVPAYAAAAAIPPQGLATDHATAPPVPPPAVAAADQPRIVLLAREDNWVQLRDKAGQVLLNRVLSAGETWPVKSGVLLTTGNAGALELLVDGLPVPSIGGSGVVRRNLPLDPDLLKDGKLPAQVATLAGPPKQYGPPAPAVPATVVAASPAAQ